MDQSYLPFLCGAGLIFSIIPGSMLFYWISKRGWLTLRLIALLIFLLISSIGGMIWVYERNKVLSLSMLGLGILAGFSVLSWPVISPKLVKLLNLKW
jgi:hypothetical protein